MREQPERNDHGSLTGLGALARSFWITRFAATSHCDLRLSPVPRECLWIAFDHDGRRCGITAAGVSEL